MPHEIGGTAKCLICRKVFLPPVALLGQGSKAEQFVQLLTSHLLSEHTNDAKQFLKAGQDYAAMLLLRQFEVSDKDTFAQIDLLRWGVHQNSIGARVTDKALADLVAKVVPELVALAVAGDSATITKNLSGFALGLRDLLEEPGKYVSNLRPV